MDEDYEKERSCFRFLIGIMEHSSFQRRKHQNLHHVVMANYDQKEYLRKIISDALQEEVQKVEYSIDAERTGEQYKIANADYEAFREKYSIK